MKRFLVLAMVLGGCAERSGRDVIPRVEVTVTVRGNDSTAAPLAGATVAFVDPDGEGYLVQTNADGTVTGVVVPGGSVTALVGLVPASNPPFLSTVLGVQEGDVLDLGWHPSDAQPAPTGTASCDETNLVATYRNIAGSGVAGISLAYAGEGPLLSEYAPSPLGATAEIPMTYPGVAEAHLQTSLGGPMLTGPMYAQQYIDEIVDGCATTYDVDVSQILPWVDVASMHSRVIDVALEGGTLEADVMRTSVSYELAQDSYVNWELVGPQGETIALPELPGELADLLPVTDQLHSSAVTLVDVDGVNGYAEGRSMLGPSGGHGGQESTTQARTLSSYRITLY